MLADTIRSVAKDDDDTLWNKSNNKKAKSPAVKSLLEQLDQGYLYKSYVWLSDFVHGGPDALRAVVVTKRPQPSVRGKLRGLAGYKYQADPQDTGQIVSLVGRAICLGLARVAKTQKKVNQAAQALEVAAGFEEILALPWRNLER